MCSDCLLAIQETYVVMEWCDRGSLESAVSDGVFHQHQAGLLEEQANMPTVCATLLDIAAGMAYLHKMHILHCDLKLRNLLLKSSQASATGSLRKASLVQFICFRSLLVVHHIKETRRIVHIMVLFSCSSPRPCGLQFPDLVVFNTHLHQVHQHTVAVC